MTEITYEQANDVCGAGAFGAFSGVLAVSAATFGVLAIVATGGMALPIAVAAGTAGGLSGILAVADALSS